MNPAGGDDNNNAAIIDALFEGIQELAPEEFDEFAIGPDILPHPGTNIQYLLACVGDSIWLHPEDYRFLITDDEMNITYDIPANPQPPAIYKIPIALIPNILPNDYDGHGWHRRRRHIHMIDDGPIVDSYYEYENVAGPDRVHRRIYFVAGNNDVCLIHYKVLQMNWNTSKMY